MRQLRITVWLAALLGCVVVNLLSLIDAVNYLAALATAVAPLTVVAAGASLLLSIILRRWLIAAPSVGLIFISIVLPMSPGPSSGLLVRPADDDLIVVSSNIRAGNDELPELIAGLLSTSPDVIVFLEVTDREMAIIGASDIGESHPHTIVDPRDGYFGSAIVSRLPLRGNVAQVGGYPMIDATVTTNNGDIKLIGVHVAPPISGPSFESWTEQLSALEAKLLDAESPTVLVGDFNATPQHRRLRRLAAVSVSSGLGVGPSFSVPSWAPAVLALDHVFSAGGACVVEATLLDAAGSDHRALRAVIGLPYSPDRSCR